MSDFQKKLLGVLTAWPFAYFLLFFAFIFGMIALDPGELQGFFALGFLLVMLIHFLTIFLIIGLQIFYIVNVFKNDRVGKDQKIIWTIALFLGGLFAMPIYWYMNIWREVPDGGQYRGLTSGDEFDPAHRAEWETRTGDPVPPEPHSWR
jgi:hypothetical protein